MLSATGHIEQNKKKNHKSKTKKKKNSIQITRYKLSFKGAKGQRKKRLPFGGSRSPCKK